MIHFKRDEEVISFEDILPLIPLREVVVFPFMVTPLIIARDASVKALEQGISKDRLLFLVAQRSADVEQPDKKDIYRSGVVARILQVLKLPNGLVRILVEGLARARITRFLAVTPYMRVKIVLKEDTAPPTPHIHARLRTVLNQFTEYVKINAQVPDELLLSLQNVSDPQRMSDTMAAYIIQTPQVKQRLIEAKTITDQLEELSSILSMELEILEIKNHIDSEVRDRIHKTQREFFLQEQMRVIKQELGDMDEFPDDISELAQQVGEARMPKAVYEKAMSELDKLQQMHPTSPEAAVARNYLEWLIAVPWSRKTRDSKDIDKVEAVLNADHYSLDKPKERIIEYLSVIQLTRAIKGPILCLVGPPGVGKTSLGKSIARAMGRKFVRMSLGGVHDEAEIRGHRRTYIGSMPGRIIQAMRKAGTTNPVILLDEIDKLGRDMRGDPASAMLEVLDPEQNSAFNDHYLDVDYDLSRVLFITTANTTHSIPPALRDRMEIIQISGYLEYEKLAIAKEFLAPKQVKSHGLSDAHLLFQDDALLTVIRDYTREAGVRDLERHLATVCRKTVRKVVQKQLTKQFVIDTKTLRDYLGTPKYQDSEVMTSDTIGVATGLAWTEVGGEVLTIEVSILHRNGPGRLTLTGQLGDVMQESAQAALAYARSRATALGLDPDFYKNIEIHIHMPEGAIPKDGPSAGITMATALCSALTGRPIRCDIAMTGEITLRGHVLPIGGLNEKLLAARRAKVMRIIVPKRNQKEVGDLPEEIKKGLELHLVETMDEVLALALGLAVSEPTIASIVKRHRTPPSTLRTPVV